MTQPKTLPPNSLAIYAMAFGNFAMGIGTLIIAGILPGIAETFEVRPSQVGQLVTVYAFAYAIGSPIIIALTGRFEPRIILTSGLSLAVLGNTLAALSPSFWILFGARILTAFGAASFIPLAASTGIALVKPTEQGRVSSLVFGGFAVATAFGIPLGTYIGLTFGWRISFGLVAMLATVAAVLVWRELPPRIAMPTVNLTSFGNVFGNGLLIAIFLVILIQIAGQTTLFTYISPWLIELTSLGALGITLMLLINGVGGIVGNGISGWSTDRFGPRVTQLVFLLVLGAALFAMPVVERSLVLGGGLFFLWGFVGQGFIAPQLVRVVGVAPVLASASLALNSSFINIGFSGGSLIGGVVLERSGIEMLPLWASAFLGLALIVFGLSWWAEDRLNATNHPPESA